RDALPAEPSAEGLAAAETEQRRAQGAVDDLDSAIIKAQNDVARATVERESALARLGGAREAQAEHHKLTDDMAQWRLLAKALGRDGLVALSIDDAGPTISGLANDLLLTCYGPRFSMRFDTQAETRDGKLKESFDIRVFDGEQGEEKSIRGATSGGERILLNDSLTRGIALFKARESGQQFEALFSDESDGALDPERKEHFMRMKRKVLEIGGYTVEYFITHTKELWEMADHIIDLRKLRAA
ncbi:MAG TPA: hypothetical protein VNX47_05820, partial [Nevskia sp.]|nr:hypothetical protein [Nevskia sp.]